MLDRGSGFIPLYRKMLKWEWYENTNVKCLFLHCLLKANYTEKKWQGILIEKGSFLTSLASLSKELNMTVQQIRTSLNKLESTNEITIKSTNKYRIIKVNNYSYYNQDNKQDNNQVTNNQQTNNKQITTTNKDNKVNKDKKEKNKILYSDFVKLTEEEYSKLIEKLGINQTNDFIERLNDYIGSKGKKYKSHYHTILSWNRKDIKESKPATKKNINVDWFEEYERNR